MLTFFRSALLALLVAALLVLPPSSGARAQQTAIGACGDPSAPYAEVEIDTFPRLNLQLARTVAEHEQGLMYVQYMPPDNGMLFMYAAQADESYWMYHTLIPLSIAWIDRDGTIVDIQDMPVLSDPNNVQEASRTVYSPAAPYWYALEANQGWFADHGVGVGQQMQFCLG